MQIFNIKNLHNVLNCYVRVVTVRDCTVYRWAGKMIFITSIFLRVRYVSFGEVRWLCETKLFNFKFWDLLQKLCFMKINVNKCCDKLCRNFIVLVNIHSHLIIYGVNSICTHPSSCQLIPSLNQLILSLNQLILSLSLIILSLSLVIFLLA